MVFLTPGLTFLKEEEIEQRVYPQRELSHQKKKRAVVAALLIGTSIAAALGTGTGGISTSAYFYYKLSQEFHEDMEQVVESFVSVPRQINSLASVALQSRRALDLLTVEKGGTCLFLGEDCCSFVNETGIVQGRVKELRDRIELRRKELPKKKKKSYKTFTVPKTCSNRPSLGCSLSWDHWYLSLYFSYLDPVSSLSFKGFSKNGFGPSLETRSRPLFLRASPRPQEKETLGPRMILCSRPRMLPLSSRK